jgi:DNA-binding transcriptional MerR regulator
MSMLTIGKLASRTQLSTNALRFYEREGLLVPASKSRSGYRLYDESAVACVGFIKYAQQCGFTLTGIHELLTLRSSDSACCEDVRRLVVEKKLQLEAKIRSMQVMSEALGLLISGCPGHGRPAEGCPILGAMEEASARPNA